MDDRIDLHIHSEKSSDGDLSVQHIVHLAKEKGLKAISISDHDTVAAYPEALQIGKEVGVEVIPSIELTTIFEDREFHLLLPFVEWEKTVVKDLAKKVAERRRQEAQERVQKLQELGFDISWKEVIEESGPYPPLGVSIAQIVLNKGEKAGDRALSKYLNEKNRMNAPYLFYRDYFMEGKTASVPRRNLNILEVLKTVPQTGSTPVLAHPGAYFQRVKKEDLVRLKNEGLEGLEVYTSYHDIQQERFYKGLAEELDLIPTSGSDFHGTIKPHIPFGSINRGGYWMIEELKKRRP